MDEIETIFSKQLEYLAKNKPVNKIKPLVSILVLTYQHVNYIEDCLNSILMQKTNFPFEIVIGEDESNDGTREKCMAYAEKYSDKIRLFLRDRRQSIFIKEGKTIYMNGILTLKSCRGKYIAMCEGDDYWTDSTKLQKQVAFLEKNPKYAICFHRVFEKVYDKKTSLSDLNTSLIEKTYTINDIAKENFIHTPSVIFRNNIENNFPNWFTQVTAGDYALHLINASYGKIKYFPSPMAVHRVHDGGMWSQKAPLLRIQKWMEGLSYLINEFDEGTVNLNLRQQLQFYLTRFESIIMGQDEDLKHYLIIKDIISSNESVFLDWVINKNTRFKKLSESTDYKVGKLILKPIRRLRRAIKKLTLPTLNIVKKI